MTSEDVKDLISAIDRQTKCLESIAKSLERLANPPAPNITFAPPGSNATIQNQTTFTIPPKL